MDNAMLTSFLLVALNKFAIIVGKRMHALRQTVQPLRVKYEDKK